jgi:hypothetical protein
MKNDGLDHLLTAVKAHPLNVSLDDFESKVVRQIRARETESIEYVSTGLNLWMPNTGFALAALALSACVSLFMRPPVVENLNVAQNISMNRALGFDTITVIHSLEFDKYRERYE